MGDTLVKGGPTTKDGVHELIVTDGDGIALIRVRDSDVPWTAFQTMAYEFRGTLEALKGRREGRAMVGHWCRWICSDDRHLIMAIDRSRDEGRGAVQLRMADGTTGDWVPWKDCRYA